MFQKAIVLGKILCDNINSKVMASGGGGWLQRSKRGVSEGVEMLYILFWVVVAQVYTLDKNDWIEHWGSTHFIVRKSYLNYKIAIVFKS